MPAKPAVPTFSNRPISYSFGSSMTACPQSGGMAHRAAQRLTPLADRLNLIDGSQRICMLRIAAKPSTALSNALEPPLPAVDSEDDPQRDSGRREEAFQPLDLMRPFDPGKHSSPSGNTIVQSKSSLSAAVIRLGVKCLRAYTRVRPPRSQR